MRYGMERWERDERIKRVRCGTNRQSETEGEETNGRYGEGPEPET